MSDVFVSYKAEDRRRVQPLVQALEAEGFSVWWDAQIGGGSAWRRSIETELAEAKCVVVVWSKRSVGPAGEFVQDEATRAKRRNVYLPVTIDKVEPPLGFGETQALPLRKWSGDRSDSQYRALLGAIEAMVHGQSHARAYPAPRRGIDRRALLAGAAGVAALAAAAGWTVLHRSSSAPDNTVAVLPFENLSGDPAQAYFSDGIAEELRSALARIAQLKVVARTSSEMVRNDDATTAARKLGVTNILTGSVRRSANVIRIATQLVDGRSGVELWSATYDRQPGDTLKIQEDIAEKVADALNVRFGHGGSALKLGDTDNPAAQDAYLKALGMYTSYTTAASLHQALAFADAAIAADPRYAKAYALKSMIQTILAGNFTERINGEEAARRAVQLAPNLSAAHVALAKFFVLHSDLQAALQEFQRAAKTGSNRSEFLTEYSMFLTQLGRTEEAVSLARKAEAVDPLNLKSAEAETTALFIGARYGEAIQRLQRILRLAPDRWYVRLTLGDAFMLSGKNDLAAQQFAMTPPDTVRRLRSDAILASRMGNRPLSDQKLARLIALHGDVAKVEIAQIYAQRGQTEQAFAALNDAVATRELSLGWIGVDPLLAPIRGDPRFQALERKAGLPVR